VVITRALVSRSSVRVLYRLALSGSPAAAKRGGGGGGGGGGSLVVVTTPDPVASRCVRVLVERRNSGRFDGGRWLRNLATLFYCARLTLESSRRRGIRLANSP